MRVVVCVCVPAVLLTCLRVPTVPLAHLCMRSLPIYPPSCLFTHLLTRPLGRPSRPAYSASPRVSRSPCRLHRCLPSSLSVVEPAPLVRSSAVCSRGLCPVCSASPCAPRLLCGLLTFTHPRAISSACSPATTARDGCVVVTVCATSACAALTASSNVALTTHVQHAMRATVHMGDATR
ncbi:uncharacterized protein C8Q71DRAFT_751865 [Rhodofomes roseus]|uniref:Secreted protein n=1 Tax=Rhodofomes roseus TaxID=34475 RepID=A0ABQ8KK87_9APHY|nr:uncharacterized protein C8Q71DRAFT_751865 [Rhodofomes roseus]KAH9838564.1 hypothetical protein C8Q71DRAFT_751865 [Rhodofomes roseus]